MLYHAADCYAGGSDVGAGSFKASSQTVGCVHDNGDGTFFQEQFIPQTPGAQSVEDFYNSIWSDIATQTLLPGTCTCEQTQDNGAGLSRAFPLSGTTPITQSSQLVIVSGNSWAIVAAAARFRLGSSRIPLPKPSLLPRNPAASAK